MLFWFAILIGALTAWLLGKKSLYSNWILLFNILVSIYVGVMLSPVLLEMLAGRNKGIGFNCAIFILLIVVIVFVILYLITKYNLVPDDVEVDFYYLLELIGTRVTAFFSGFCVAALVIFLIAVMIMPYKFSPWMKFIRSENEPVTVVTVPITKVCNFVNTISLQRYTDAPMYILTELTNLGSPEKIEEILEPIDEEQFPDLLTTNNETGDEPSTINP